MAAYVSVLTLEWKWGPDKYNHTKFSLREWVNYVIHIPSLDFQRNVIFISYANIVLRRQRITGLTAHKPISRSVEEAVKELIQVSHSSRPSNVPDATLNALAKKVSTYVDQLPGSLADMGRFRNDILSMKKKHGSPSYFLPLSSADSMWPEGFLIALNGKITVEQAKKLSASERADLMAENHIAFTLAWKKRIQGFLDFVINGESKPLGEITHYVQKAEWQGRLSEHAHFLFWTKDGIPSLQLHENGELKGEQEHIASKAESLASAFLHFHEHSLSENDPYSIIDEETSFTTKSSYTEEMKPLTRDEIFHSLTQQPSSFHNYFYDGKARKSINNLIRFVNLHTL